MHIKFGKKGEVKHSTQNNELQYPHSELPSQSKNNYSNKNVNHIQSRNNINQSNRTYKNNHYFDSQYQNNKNGSQERNRTNSYVKTNTSNSKNDKSQDLEGLKRKQLSRNEYGSNKYPPNQTYGYNDRKKPKTLPRNQGTKRNRHTFQEGHRGTPPSHGSYKKRKTERHQNSGSQEFRIDKNADVVEYNKLISHFGTQKKLGTALKVYETLKSKFSPTIYTYSALINSCVRCGEIQQAIQFNKEMIQNHIQPNEITYTILIKGLSQEDKFDELLEVLEEMKKMGIAPNIRTSNTILRGCLRWGKTDIAEKIFKEMSTLRINPDATSFGYIIKCLCQELRMNEAWNMIQQMQKRNLNYSPAYSALATSSALIGDEKLAKLALKEAENAVKMDLNSTKQFKSDIKASIPLFLKLRNEEVERECNRVKEYLPLLANRKDKTTKFGHFLESERVMLFKSNSKKLNFGSIFGNDNPVRLEVCSGHGDWIVERAKKDPKSNWIALEIRFERVFQIWSKMIFNDLDNLLILGGEAHYILQNCVVDNSINEVFVNYPDPPVWEESKQRLIDKPFLLSVHRILKPDSSITIVTDDKPYCESAAQEFTQLTDLFQSAFNSPFVDQLPQDYGSSYFDRMWKNGNRIKRYFIKHLKISQTRSENDDNNTSDDDTKCSDDINESDDGYESESESSDGSDDEPSDKSNNESNVESDHESDES